MRPPCALHACVAAAFLLAGCSADPDAPTEDDSLAAEFQGGGVTLEELDARIAVRLEGLQNQIYQARREALEPLVTERLVEAEARDRGMTVEQLLEVEVRQRVPTPDASEIEAFYRQYPERFEQDTKAVAFAKIEDAMYRAQAEQRRDAFERDLRLRRGVRIRLEPPRREVGVPDDAPAIGPRNAPVTIVEFTDYQCPYCRRAQQTVAAVLERYGDSVRLVYRDLPLDAHPEAAHAARAARCAGDQGRFWEYHRGLLEGLENDFEQEALVERAASLGLDVASFEGCLAGTRHDDVIARSIDEAARLAIGATPTFFINGRRLVGARPYEDFAAIIDDELARAGT